ncbi:MAG: hypothetical protein ACXU8U_05555 [Asticcacaulis sp.]
MKLTTAQQAWLTAHIESGEFASPEDALARLIDDRMAEESDDDMAWAKPYFDEGIADVARGDVLTIDEHRARNKGRVAALQSRKL